MEKIYPSTDGIGRSNRKCDTCLYENTDDETCNFCIAVMEGYSNWTSRLKKVRRSKMKGKLLGIDCSTGKDKTMQVYGTVENNHVEINKIEEIK